MKYESDFISAIKVRQADIAVSLTAGHVVNFETYQRLVGQYAGLEEALQILNDILK
jgi:hypothetical protein